MGAAKHKKKKVEALTEVERRERQHLLSAGLYPPRSPSITFYNDKIVPSEKAKPTRREQKEKEAQLRRQEKLVLSMNQSPTSSSSARKASSSTSTEPEEEKSAMQFGTRMLGSNDVRIRHFAMEKMGKYLQTRSGQISASAPGLTYLEMLKLWKAMWFALYMCDRVAVQHELAERMATLLWCTCGKTVEEDVQEGMDYMEQQHQFMEQEMAKEEQMDEDFDDYDDYDDDDDDDDDDDVEILEVIHGGQDDEEDDSSEDDMDEEMDQNPQKRKRKLDNTKHKKKTKKNPKRAKSEQEDSDDEDDNDDSSDDENDESDDEEESEAQPEQEEEEESHQAGVYLTSLFVRAFFHTVRRQWDRMDIHRVDKFLTMIRRMLAQIFTYMATRQWNTGIIHLFHDHVFFEMVCPDDKESSLYPNGMRYQMIDCVVDELARASCTEYAGGDAGGVGTFKCEVLKTVPFLDCLEPYLSLARGEAGDKVLRMRTLEMVLMRFLTEYSGVREGIEDEKDKDTEKEQDGTDEKEEEETQEEEEKFNLDEVNVRKVAVFLFDMASDPDYPDFGRSGLYDVQKEYLRRMKEVGYTGETDADDRVEMEEGDVDVEEEEEEEDMEEEEEDVPTKVDPKQDKKKKKKSKKEKSSTPTEALNELEDVPPHATKESETQADESSPKEVETEGSKKEKKKKKKKEKEKKRKRADKTEVTADVPENEANTEIEESKKTVAKKGDTTHVSEASKDALQKKSGSTKRAKQTDDPNIEKSKKSDAKQKKIDDDDIEMDEAPQGGGKDSADALDTTLADESDSSETKKSKKKKKKKKKKHEKDVPNKEEEEDKDEKQEAEQEEEEIIISAKEQRAAAKAAVSREKKTQKKSQEKSADDNENVDDVNDPLASPDANRRVQFGKPNLSKSYKASMKALRTMDQPSTKARTPDRSILRNVDWAKTATGSGKRGKKNKRGSVTTPTRKRASDWF